MRAMGESRTDRTRRAALRRCFVTSTSRWPGKNRFKLLLPSDIAQPMTSSV